MNAICLRPPRHPLSIAWQRNRDAIVDQAVMSGRDNGCMRWKQRLAVPAIVIAEYLAMGALLAGCVALLQPRTSAAECGIDSCAFDGLAAPILATVGGMLTVLGLIASLAAVAIRARGTRRRGHVQAEAHPLLEATTSAGIGLVSALFAAMVLL